MTGRDVQGRRRAIAVIAVVVVTLVGCTDPLPTSTPDQSVTASPSPTVPDPEEEALAARVAALRTTVVALREELTAAAADDDPEALERAGTLLVAELEAARDPVVARSAATEEPIEPTSPTDTTAPPSPGVGGLAPLLPGPVVSRARTVSYGDLLTSTLAAARGAGTAGEPVARFLATPLAGDLGVWQRSPADLLALVAEAGTTERLADAEAAVLALDGEAPRALAWVVHGLETSTTATEAAGRAAAHLAVVETALQELP